MLLTGFREMAWYHGTGVIAYETADKGFPDFSLDRTGTAGCAAELCSGSLE